jgi:hypothetical protein
MEGIPLYDHTGADEREWKNKEESKKSDTERSDIDYVATEEEVFDALDKAYKDKKLQIKLLGFINSFIITKAGRPVIDNKNAEEFLTQAIDKVITLKRRWKKNRIPNIVNLIILAAISDIRHTLRAKNSGGITGGVNSLIYDDLLPEKQQKGEEEAKRQRNRKKPVIIPLTAKDKEGQELPDSIADIEKARSYEENYFGLENLNGDFEEIIAKIETELDDDENAFFVFQERIDGVKSNKEIAAKLGICVRDVENALKRIKRVILK